MKRAAWGAKLILQQKNLAAQHTKPDDLNSWLDGLTPTPTTLKTKLDGQKSELAAAKSKLVGRTTKLVGRAEDRVAPLDPVGGRLDSFKAK